jgi:tetratricopeptide (TPR) repeat protein
MTRTVAARPSFGQRTWTYAAVLVLSLAGPSIWAEGGDTKYSSECSAAVVSGDWSALLASAKAWGQGEPDSTVASWLLGYGAVATGDYKTAGTAFARPTGTDDADRLLQWAEEVAKAHPGAPLALVLRGDALARAGRLDEARAALDAAVAADPSMALAHDVRGVVRALSGDRGGATEDFGKALDLDPGLADAYVNLAIVCTSAGDYATALSLCDQAISISEQNALAFSTRGVVYTYVKQWDLAQADFGKAAELCPGHSFVSRNLDFLAWARAQDKARADVEATKQGAGMSIQVTPYTRDSVNLGQGRTIDIITIRNTPETATVEGVQKVLAQVEADLRGRLNLPETWRIVPLVAQPGLNSSANAERDNLARHALYGGKDIVLSADLTDQFQWNQRALVVGPEATHRVERLVAAANREFGGPPDLLLASQATRLVADGAMSTTLSTLYRDGALHEDFRVGKVICAGVPLPNMTIDPGFRRDRIQDAIAFTSPSWSKLVGSEPIGGASRIEVKLATDRGVPHYALNQPVWPDGRANPLPQLAGLAMRGIETPAIQSAADELRIRVPVYKCSETDPQAIPITMASMTGRSLTTGDGVLIASRDRALGETMALQFGDKLRTKIVSDTDPGRLQTMAAAEGMRAIALVQPPGTTARTAALSPAACGLDGPGRLTVPEIESMATGIERLGKLMSIVAKSIDFDVPLGAADAVQHILPALLRDEASGFGGNLSTSHTFEQFAGLALGHIPAFAKRLADQGLISEPFATALSSPLRGGLLAGAPDLAQGIGLHIGEGQALPSWRAVDSYLGAINKGCAYALGNQIGGPKMGSAFATGAGLVDDVLSDWTYKKVFEPAAMAPVRKSVIDDYSRLLTRAATSSVPAQHFSDIYGAKELMKMGFSPREIQVQNDRAGAASLFAGARGGQNLPSMPQFRERLPEIRPDLASDLDLRHWGVWRPPPPGPPAAGVFGPGTPADDRRRPPPPPPGGGGAGRGGVYMTHEVRKGQPADMSGLFGGAKSGDAAASSKLDLSCPFLFFCAAPATPVAGQ